MQLIKVNFLANQSVDADAINDIRETLVQAGYNLESTDYVTYVDGETYGVDALNGITKPFVSKAGVRNGIGNNCKVVVDIDNEEVLIYTGLAFFSSGVTMTIDSTVRLPWDNTQKTYVYLFHDTDLNVAGASCAAEMPSQGEYILLATITESGIAVASGQKYCVMHGCDVAPVSFTNTNEYTYSTTMSDPEIIATDIDLSKYAMARVTYDSHPYIAYYIDLSIVALGYATIPSARKRTFDSYSSDVEGAIVGASGGCYSLYKEGWAVPMYSSGWIGIGPPDEDYEREYVQLKFDYVNSRIWLKAKCSDIVANELKIELLPEEV